MPMIQNVELGTESVPYATSLSLVRWCVSAAMNVIVLKSTGTVQNTAPTYEKNNTKS